MRSRVLLALAAFTLCSCGPKAPEKIVAPDVFRVKFETSQGDFVVETTKAWAPHGADRFYELVRIRYFDEGRFFRVLEGFIAQFGVHRDFDVHHQWQPLRIVDDPPVEKNLRGTLAFAKSGPNTRSTEIFINLADNAILDEQYFVPFGKIVEGIEVIDKLYAGYGELAPEGTGPDVGRVENATNEYLVPRFPKLDYIQRARLIP